MTLNEIQLRVLGALIEKEIVTPETYPLSLNALLAACNQRSSRDPVMDLGDEDVRQALHALEDLGMTAVVRDARVPKYEHRARTVLNLRRDETAVICLLLLRGPQTPGELRARADRLYSFDGLEAVEGTLLRLATTPQDAQAGGETLELRPLVVLLPRQPGSREARYAHLLGRPVDVSAAEQARPRARPSAEYDTNIGGTASQHAALEEKIAALQSALSEIEARLTKVEAAVRPAQSGE